LNYHRPTAIDFEVNAGAEVKATAELGSEGVGSISKEIASVSVGAAPNIKSKSTQD